MKNSISTAGAAAALLGLAAQAQAAYVFPSIPGPTNVAAGSPVAISLNDAANSSTVTSGLYATFTVTADWTLGGGNPWSNEADISMTTTAGTTTVDPATSGAGSNGDPTTLSFTGGFSSLYDPDSDGTLDLTLNQSFAGSNADWSNISVTLNELVVPTTVGSLSAGGQTFNSAYTGPEIVWLDFVYDGSSPFTIDTFGSDFDTELGIYDAGGSLLANNDDAGGGLQSEIDVTGLGAGTYLIAAGGWNTDFSAGFSVTSNSGAVGNLFVNAVPEPSSGILALMASGLLLLRRRR